MDQEEVFSEREFSFRKQVEQFVRAVEQQQPEDRSRYFERAIRTLAQMAPNPPIIPIGTGSGSGVSSGGATGSGTTKTQGTCPKCSYVFTLT